MSSADEVPPIPTPSPGQAAPAVPPVEIPPVAPSPAAPSPAPPPPAPYVAGQPQGISLAAMICGIAGAVLSLFALGLLPSVAAVILGHIGIARQPNARPLSLTGLVTGYVGIGISLLWGIIIVIFVIASLSSGANYRTY